MSVNEIYRASNIFTAPGSDGDMVFTLHYRTTDVSTPISDAAEAGEIATEIKTAIEDEYLPDLGDTFTFVETKVIGITNPLVQALGSSGDPGLAVGDSLSLRSSPVIKLITGIRGRSYNGRMFLMAPTEGSQAEGVISAGYVTVIGTLTAALLTLTGASSGNTYKMTIYSPTLSTPPTTFIDNIVTTFSINTTMGSQRRRQLV